MLSFSLKSLVLGELLLFVNVHSAAQPRRPTYLTAQEQASTGSPGEHSQSSPRSIIRSASSPGGRAEISVTSQGAVVQEEVHELSAKEESNFSAGNDTNETAAEHLKTKFGSETEPRTNKSDDAKDEKEDPDLRKAENELEKNATEIDKKLHEEDRKIREEEADKLKRDSQEMKHKEEEEDAQIRHKSEAEDEQLRENETENDQTIREEAAEAAKTGENNYSRDAAGLAEDAATIASSRNAEPEGGPTGEGEKKNVRQSLWRTLQEKQKDAKIALDGLTEELRPAATVSEANLLIAEDEDCMLHNPMWACFQKHGSYGIKRLRSEAWSDIYNLGYDWANWMSHPNVMKKLFFDVTFPGSHNSATYQFSESMDHGKKVLANFGAKTQDLQISQQLQMGVRALDIRISWDFDRRLLCVSHRVMGVPLFEILREILIFLDTHPNEVIVIHAKTGRSSGDADKRYILPLLQEAEDPNSVPGQMVHEEFMNILGPRVATYDTLRRLPHNESMENPSIGALVGIGVRVVYFWEGLQVLCVNKTSCDAMDMPFKVQNANTGAVGANRPPSSSGSGTWSLTQQGNGSARTEGTTNESDVRPVPNPPAPGNRTLQNGYVEPACFWSTWQYTQTGEPDKVVDKAKAYFNQMHDIVERDVPFCYPSYVQTIDWHKPSLMHLLDLFITINAADMDKVKQTMQNVEALFTRGEGFTIRTMAERVNYLVLTNLLKEGTRDTFMQPNIISTDFVHPTIVSRIIEGNQGHTDCGFAMVCIPSGTCLTMSLMDRSGGCLAQEEAVTILEEHSQAQDFDERSAVLLFINVCTCCCFCCCFCGIRRRIKARRRKKAAMKQALLAAQLAAQAANAGADKPKEQGVAQNGSAGQAAVAGGSQAAASSGAPASPA